MGQIEVQLGQLGVQLGQLQVHLGQFDVQLEQLEAELWQVEVQHGQLEVHVGQPLLARCLLYKSCLFKLNKQFEYRTTYIVCYVANGIATDGYNVSPLLCRHLFLHAELHVVVSRIEGVTYVEIASSLHVLQHITAPLENQEI